MKTPICSLLLWFALTLQVRGESQFAGTFFSGQDTGMIAGSIVLAATEGEASFTCTLFSYVPATNLQVWLAVDQREIPIDLGNGTLGTWPLNEFLWPVPGTQSGTQTGIDPGFAIPPSSEGTRFTGTFTMSRGLERLLITHGGTVYLKASSGAAGVQNSTFQATLQNITPPVPVHFTALCSGRAEYPPNSSPYHATVEFDLSANNLSYTLTSEAGFAWISAGIYAFNSPSLVARLDTSLGVFSVNLGQTAPASGATYSGTVALTEQQATELKRGLLFVNFLTTRYPSGEIRGRIQWVPASLNNEADQP